MRGKGILAFVAVAAVLVMSIAAGCGSDSSSTTTSPSAAASQSGEPVAIAFFGFAKANSFAQATFSGIEDYASKNNATAKFFDGGFSAPTQVSQIQDAITSGKYQVFIVQANDGAAVIPAVEQAIAKDIVVVAEFTPIGTKYDTAEPQVEGMYFVGDVITDNGVAIAELGLQAAEEAGISEPVIAYLQGMPTLPLDNARTDAAVSTLEAGGAKVISNLVGGYSQDEGRKVGQDLFAAHPDVNVVIGSAQSIAGVERVIPAALKGKVFLVGNGGSTQAVTAVQEGRWFACYYYPEPLAGAKAAEVGIGVARGETMPKSVTESSIAEENGFSVMGTKAALEGRTGWYDD
ncbi:MAG TPA: sugar ABC transporter substrate-binding protein [Thermoleophilia bacterium]|nr:sugar ABC transporter substrate-binding protein [Thermoleophilia bacterium]